MDSKLSSQIEPDENFLKEIVLKICEWGNYLKTKWLIIFLIGMICGGIGYLYAFSQKQTYTAALTFTLEEEKSNGGGLSGALGIANSLGIDIGGGGTGSAFSGANLLELMKSRTLVERTLLNPIVVHGQTKSLVDYFIEFKQLNKGWNDNPILKKIKFNSLDDRSRFTLQQDSILGGIYEQIIGKGGLLSVSQKDKKTNIISIEVKSENELFSKCFAETIAKVVSDFYIETKSKKAKLNYGILQKQTDSVRNELDAAIIGVAVANDNTYNLNPALNIHRTPSSKRQIDIQANTAILTQLVTNLEMAKVSLRKETPLIQIIDSPILPLRKERMSKLRSLVIGGFLGVMITVVILVLMQEVKRVMKD